jgi:hypothetical protein
MMKRALATLALAAALGGLGAASPTAPAATAADLCQSWNDQHTYGVTCSADTQITYQAVAECSDGKWYRGPLVTTGWSYVYCSAHGGNYVSGYPAYTLS